MVGCREQAHKNEPGRDDDHDPCHRHNPATSHNPVNASCCSRVETEFDHVAGHDAHTPTASPVPIEAKFSHLAAPETVADGIRTPMRTLKMDCPTEAEMIRKKLDGMAAVKGLEFNLVQRVLTVVHTPDTLEPILEAIRSLGFKPELPDANG